MNVDYSVVIPVYNSEKSLNELIYRIDKVFSSIKKKYEIVFVNDNSRDNSWEVLKNLAKKNNNIKLINLMKNFGQHNALMCGFNHVDGKYIITMDDDLQHPPEEILKLIKKINEGYEVVYGQYLDKKHRFYRNIGSNFINLFMKKITGIKCKITAFRIISKNVIDKIIKFDNYNVVIEVCLSKVLSNRYINYCYVKHDKRKYGKTNYTFKKLFLLAFDTIFNFTIIPLRLSTYTGLFFSLFSFIIGIFYLYQYFMNQISVNGFTALILSITFFSGIILFVLGIIGEYIGRMYIGLNKKPQYIIKEMK